MSVFGPIAIPNYILTRTKIILISQQKVTLSGTNLPTQQGFSTAARSQKESCTILHNLEKQLLQSSIDSTSAKKH